MTASQTKQIQVYDQLGQSLSGYSIYWDNNPYTGSTSGVTSSSTGLVTAGSHVQPGVYSFMIELGTANYATIPPTITNYYYPPSGGFVAYLSVNV